MIRVLDYGVGNVQALLNLFRSSGVRADRAACAEDLRGAGGLVLPGVGAFDHAMQRLNASGLRPELERLALEEKRPLLGICIGMHMLSQGSDEGVEPGLGFLKGRAKRLESGDRALRLPHMGWNDLQVRQADPLIDANDLLRFYFLHSFHLDGIAQSEIVAKTSYGIEFPSMVRKETIWGIQFHPEKSHRSGESLLLSFARVAGC